MPGSGNKSGTGSGMSGSSVEPGLAISQAEMLLNLSRTMAAYETLDDMLETLVEIIVEEIGAERGTIFLADVDTGELYSRVAQGNFHREIRIMDYSGVAGQVYKTGKGMIVHDAYKSDFFNKSVDEMTGFTTKSILSVPIRTVRGEVIGVAQVLNKKRGRFTKEDEELLNSMTTQAAIALQSTQFIERAKMKRAKDLEFFNVVSDVISEIDLDTILQKVMAQTTQMLNAERSTLFINDEKKKELYARVGEGLESDIRIPNDQGIAGAVFTSGESVNIPYAYADLRFNPEVDRKTGFFTRSILCVPVVNKNGKTIGVTQVLNKRGGTFTDEDEFRLRAFTGQISIALENAKLFRDVQYMKKYNDSILESMTNGLITISDDETIATCNRAGLKILQLGSEKDIIGKKVEDIFQGANAWVMEKIQKVKDTHEVVETMDGKLEFDEKELSVNLNVLPLVSVDPDNKDQLGIMIMIEDISEAKRVKSTMAKYIDPELTDKLLEGEFLEGKYTTATVLFSDIRGFTTHTEELGAQGTVALLNEYFTVMVDSIQKHGGVLDKFIGDAIMAAFGIPLPGDNDEDSAVRAAIDMIQSLIKWNEKRIQHGKRIVDMGIGLNTDKIVIGNIGSPKRMDLTMIGDGVNLASRLEGACKTYHARILISEFTYNRLKGAYRIREVDRIIVKGKTEPVGIYEVLDYHTEDTFPNFMEVMNLFKDGLSLYRKRNWTKAINNFEKALEAHPGDELSRMYIQRCQYFKENPPEDDWDGVTKMTSK